MTDALTRNEETLVVALASVAAARTGALAKELGFAEPTQEETAEMCSAMVRALTAFVVGLREPGPAPGQDVLAELIEGIAQGAVAKVLGLPPLDLHTRH